MLFGNTMPMPNNNISSSAVRNNTNDDVGKAKKLLMSYSSAVLCRSSSSSSSAFSEASAPPSSTSSSSSCSSCSSPPRGYVPRTTEESKRVPKRQQRWKRWRNESSQPVFVRSSSSSLHSLDSASSNSSGIGTSGAETPPATVTTPPLSASTEVQQQHPEQARTSSSLSGKSGVRGSDGLGTAAHYSVPMELEKFEDLSLSHCSLPSGHSTTLPEPVFLLDLSHPILQQFYLQQRLFYRQIYAQQLAALSARLGLAPSSVEETVFDPLVPHQHLGFPPAPPPVGQMANLGMFFNSATNADASSPHCDQALPHDAVLPTDCSPAAMAAPFSSTDQASGCSSGNFIISSTIFIFVSLPPHLHKIFASSALLCSECSVRRS